MTLNQLIQAFARNKKAPERSMTATTPRSWRDRLPVHPAADLFPMLDDTELDEMAADIEANNNSLINLISLWRASPEAKELVLLDGRNRASALEGLGLPLFKDDGQPNWAYFRTVGDDPAFDPIAFIVSANIRRRDLNPSQRAMIAANLANMRQGARTDLPSIEGKSHISQAQAAHLLNVSVATVERAATVLREGSPDLAKQVERGEVPVSAAAKSIKAAKAGPKETQRRALREKSALAPPKQPDHGPKVSPATERDMLVGNVCKWLRGDLRGAIDSLELMLRDEKSRIEALPREKRVFWAHAILRTLGVTVDDLKRAI